MGTPGDKKKADEVVRNVPSEDPDNQQFSTTFPQESLVLQLPEPQPPPPEMTVLSRLPALQQYDLPLVPTIQSTGPPVPVAKKPLPIPPIVQPPIVQPPLVQTKEERPLSTLEQAHIEDYFSQSKFYPEDISPFQTILEPPPTEQTSTILTLGEPGPSGLQSHFPKSEKSPKKLKKSHQSLSKKSHVCEICEKIFPNAAKLAKHQLIHSASSPFKCEQCKKTFSTKFKLVRHVLIHSDRKQFSCTICDRTFHRKDHLKNHVKVHSPCKTYYICKKPDCKKEYTSHLSYKKHIALHAAEEGSLVCQICSKSFESKEEILYHLKIHAGSRTVKNPNEKKFTCDLCDRRFFTRKDVRRHMVVHTGMRDFLCQFCPQRFGRKDHLVRHIKKSHSKSLQSQPAETIVKKEVVETETSQRQSERSVSSDSEPFGTSSYLDTLFPQTFEELPILQPQTGESLEFLPHGSSTEELKDLGSEVLKDIGEPSTSVSARFEPSTSTGFESTSSTGFEPSTSSGFIPTEPIATAGPVLLEENIVISDPDFITLLEPPSEQPSENLPLPGFVQTFQSPPQQPPPQPPPP